MQWSFFKICNGKQFIERKSLNILPLLLLPWRPLSWYSLFCEVSRMKQKGDVLYLYFLPLPAWDYTLMTNTET